LKNADAYSRNFLLASLSESDIALLQPNLSHATVNQGTMLHEANDDIATVYFPHSGMVSLLAVMQDGSAIEVATVGRQGVIGAMTGIGFNRAVTRAIGQLSGNGSKISARFFEAAVRQSPTLRELIIRHKEALLVQAQYLAACNSMHRAEARLARWILQSRDHIESDTIDLTQEFLAQMLGVTRTTMTLVAQSIQKAGLIRYRRGHIQIINVAGLETMSCECYAAIRDTVSEIFRVPCK
jgi:CRP-like cAMP-binding protein